MVCISCGKDFVIYVEEDFWNLLIYEGIRLK